MTRPVRETWLKAAVSRRINASVISARSPSCLNRALAENQSEGTFSIAAMIQADGATNRGPNQNKKDQGRNDPNFRDQSLLPMPGCGCRKQDHAPSPKGTLRFMVISPI